MLRITTVGHHYGFLKRDPITTEEGHHHDVVTLLKSKGGVWVVGDELHMKNNLSKTTLGFFVCGRLFFIFQQEGVFFYVSAVFIFFIQQRNI